METNHFDAVVFGSDLAGLLAANLMGRRGLRVLVIGHDTHKHMLGLGPYQAPSASGVIPSLETETVSRIFGELNLLPIVRRRAPVAPPAISLRVGNAAVALSRDMANPDPDARSEEATKAPSSAAEEVLSRLSETNLAVSPLLSGPLNTGPLGFWERREWARFERRIPQIRGDALAPLVSDDPLRAGLGALSAACVGFAPGDLGLIPLARALHRESRGVHFLPGGVQALRELLVDKLSTFSGEVRPGVSAVEVIQRRGRARAVRLRPRDEIIGLDQLIWAAPVADLAGLIAEPAGRRIRELSLAVRPACYRYGLVLLMEPDDLPRDLGPRTVSVLDPRRPSMEDNAILVTTGKPVPRQDGLVPLWAECLVPAATVANDLSYLGVVRSRMREHLDGLIPSLERRAVAVGSPHDGLPPQCPSVTGSQSPLASQAMPAVLSSDVPRTLGVTGTPHLSGLRNVLLAGEETLPGLGSEGAYVAAWNVANLAAEAAPRRQHRTRKMVLMES